MICLSTGSNYEPINHFKQQHFNYEQSRGCSIVRKWASPKLGRGKGKTPCTNKGKTKFFSKGILIMNEFIKIDKQKMAERLKEDICRLVGKQEFDVAYARWLDLQIVLKDLGAGDE